MTAGATGADVPAAPTVETGWSLHGQAAVVLANEHLRVVVMPGLGGKVWQVTDVRTGRGLLWHNDRVPVAPVPFGSSYDDAFVGGWDVLFPNDAAEVLAGEPFPDHGELWATGWACATDDHSVTLRTVGRISACRVMRRVTLRPGDRHLTVDVEVVNTSGRDLPFLWKEHLALAPEPGSAVHLPPSDVLIGDFGRPRSGGPGDRTRWPEVGSPPVDGRPTLDRSSRVSELLFSTGAEVGWCAMTYPDGTAVGLLHDVAVLPSCWVFASYGGWRDLEVTVLEPCSGHPVSVADGVAAGTHRVLRADEVLRTTVHLVVAHGLGTVTGVTTSTDGTPDLVGGEL
jgi:hypothetical protein